MAKQNLNLQKVILISYQTFKHSLYASINIHKFIWKTLQYSISSNITQW